MSAHAEPLSADVVAIIEYVKKSQAKTTTLAEAQECYRDVHTMLCCLLSSILTSPLTGRMFIPMPTSTGDGEAATAASARSMAAQLL